MIASLSSGHDDLQDWLLLLAAIVFAIDFVLGFVEFDTVHTDEGGTVRRHGRHVVRFVSLGLALLAVALFVL